MGTNASLRPLLGIFAPCFHLVDASCGADGSPRGVWKNENLAACVESVRLLECEAAYLFPKGADFCSPAAVNVTSEHARMGLTTTSDAGHLVFHMRSGGIYRTGLGRTDIYGQVIRK